MKKYFIIIIVFFAITPLVSYAHSGRTDSSGGHQNHMTGGYHYHHHSEAKWPILFIDYIGYTFMFVAFGLSGYCLIAVGYYFVLKPLIKYMIHNRWIAWIFWTVIAETVLIGGFWLICLLADWVKSL